MRLAWPACNAPIVGTRPTPEPNPPQPPPSLVGKGGARGGLGLTERATATCRRTSSIVVTTTGFTVASFLPRSQEHFQVGSPFRAGQAQLGGGPYDHVPRLRQLFLWGLSLDLREPADVLHVVEANFQGVRLARQAVNP